MRDLGFNGHVDSEGKGLGSQEGSWDQGPWVFKAEWNVDQKDHPYAHEDKPILAWGKEITSQIHNHRTALAALAYATWHRTSKRWRLQKKKMVLAGKTQSTSQGKPRPSWTTPLTKVMQDPQG